MKKFIIALVIAMNVVTIDAGRKTPTYRIIANSNQEKDIEEMYTIKNQLLEDFPDWVKGVDDEYQALADHTTNYQATFYNGEYLITLGKGKGKEITGRLQVSYCSSAKEIKKKSWFEELFD